MVIMTPYLSTKSHILRIDGKSSLQVEVLAVLSDGVNTKCVLFQISANHSPRLRHIALFVAVHGHPKPASLSGLMMPRYGGLGAFRFFFYRIITDLAHCKFCKKDGTSLPNDLTQRRAKILHVAETRSQVDHKFWHPY